MKNVITSIMTGCAMFAAFYMTGAFMSATFDLSKWIPELRGFMGVFGLIFSIAATAFTYALLDEKSN